MQKYEEQDKNITKNQTKESNKIWSAMDLEQYLYNTDLTGLF